MKFSIVTPTYNSKEYIEETLLSVLYQSGDFSIEHIVVDGLSTDGTNQILRDFESRLISGEIKPKVKDYKFRWISEKDDGMYDAILKGFSMSSGDIMAWINSDDKYQQDSFKGVSKALSNDKTLWIKGITDYILEDGSVKKGFLYNYSQFLIKKGIYGTVGRYIQQDSVFWKRELWNSVQYNDIRKYKLAGDFRLWQLFAEISPLRSIDVPVSCFRKRSGQLSAKIEEYRNEVDRTVSINLFEKICLKLYFFLEKIFTLLTNKWEKSL